MKVREDVEGVSHIFNYLYLPPMGFLIVINKFEEEVERFRSVSNVDP